MNRVSEFKIKHTRHGLFHFCIGMYIGWFGVFVPRNAAVTKSLNILNAHFTVIV